MFLNLGICFQIKNCPGSFVLFVFFSITVEIHFYQRVKTDFLGYRRCEALAKHIKAIFTKTLKWKDVSAQTIYVDWLNRNYAQKIQRIRNYLSIEKARLLVTAFKNSQF